MTDCFKPSPRRPYEIPWEQKAIWAFFFGSMLLIAIIGNCIVIWIVLGNLQKMQVKKTYQFFRIKNLFLFIYLCDAVDR